MNKPTTQVWLLWCSWIGKQGVKWEGRNSDGMARGCLMAGWLTQRTCLRVVTQPRTPKRKKRERCRSVASLDRSKKWEVRSEKVWFKMVCILQDNNEHPLSKRGGGGWWVVGGGGSGWWAGAVEACVPISGPTSTPPVLSLSP